MREREREALDQLNQYWDQVARQGAGLDDDGLDGAVRPLTPMVRRLHSQASSRVVDSRRAERIWRSIAAQPASVAPLRQRWLRWGRRGAGGMATRSRQGPSRSLPRLGAAACLLAVLTFATGFAYYQYTSRMAVAQQVPSRPAVVGMPHGTPGPSTAGPVTLVNAVRSSAAAAPQIRTFPSMAAARAAIPAGSILLGVLYERTPPGGRALAIYGPDCNEAGIPDLSVAHFDKTPAAIDTICPGAMLYEAKDWQDIGPNASFLEAPNGRNDGLQWIAGKQIPWISSIRFYPYYPIPPYATR